MPLARKLVIGTRTSQLAISQAEEIKKLIIETNIEYKNCEDLISIKTFTTQGDRLKEQNLSRIGGKGLFIKEIEEQLLCNTVDIAVHSMKDLPSELPPELEISAVPKRKDPRDALISFKYNNIVSIPNYSIFGTSSARRKAILLNINPRLRVVNFRGNVNTRIKKLKNQIVDSTILAVAGLERINSLNYASQIIDEDIMLPAIGQGALAVETRKIDKNIKEILYNIDHIETHTCVLAERYFLKTIEGSCNLPVAAYCRAEGKQILLKTLVATHDGSEFYSTERYAAFSDSKRVGVDAGHETIKNAKKILSLYQ